MNRRHDCRQLSSIVVGPPEGDQVVFCQEKNDKQMHNKGHANLKILTIVIVKKS